MKIQSKILDLADDNELFDRIYKSFRGKIGTWDYFVNWEKVLNNVQSIEKELNILNYLIGKEDIERETTTLILQYPTIVKAFPYLLACREKSFEVLIDVKNFISIKYNFNNIKPTLTDAKELAVFVNNSGLGEIIKNRNVKNLVDYVLGVEVGLDSNGRKNRGGRMMEWIVEVFVEQTCSDIDAEYISQATSLKIRNKWGIEIKLDKSSRIIDFVINKNGQLFFIEVNFYSGVGSKLKSTATEYIEMYNRWKSQGFEFIWITDGAGWRSTLKPLREYFDKTDYLLNLELLREGLLTKIVH